MQMDTNRLSRSPAAMRPLPRTLSASAAMTPAEPGPFTLGKGRPAYLQLPFASSSAAASSQPPALRSGRGEACNLWVPGKLQPQRITHALPPPIQPATTRQHVPRAPPPSALGHVTRGARASALEQFRKRPLPAQARWALGAESCVLGPLPPGLPKPGCANLGPLSCLVFSVSVE